MANIILGMLGASVLFIFGIGGFLLGVYIGIKYGRGKEDDGDNCIQPDHENLLFIDSDAITVVVSSYQEFAYAVNQSAKEQIPLIFSFSHDDKELDLRFIDYPFYLSKCYEEDEG